MQTSCLHFYQKWILSRVFFENIENKSRINFLKSSSECFPLHKSSNQLLYWTHLYGFKEDRTALLAIPFLSGSAALVLALIPCFLSLSTYLQNKQGQLIIVSFPESVDNYYNIALSQFHNTYIFEHYYVYQAWHRIFQDYLSGLHYTKAAAKTIFRRKSAPQK